MTGVQTCALPILFIIWISWPYVMNAWEVKESSREAGGLPGGYLIKSLILIMATLLIVQASALSLRAILQITRSKAA